MFKDALTEKLYNERFERYTIAMGHGTPDRIPIRFLPQEAAARYAGYTNQQVSCDYNLAFEATRRMASDMNFDSAMLNAIWCNYGLAKSASWRYLHVPGVDVNTGSVNQFSEPWDDEDLFMRGDEYEEFTDDPTAFIVNKWFSRATTRVKPGGEPIDFDHNTALMSGALAFANYMNAFGPAAHKFKYESGLVSANAGMIKAPLDILVDKFRGYIGTAVDTVERPEVVMKACEALMPHIVANALGGADPDKNVPITIWAHRGCVPFFSRETFDRIFWPTLKPVFEEIISHGYQILFYGEGTWEPHYDSLKELPAGSLIYHLDKGDPALAAKKFKGHFAISGGLPYDLLARGSRDDVRNGMRELFKVMKPEGGYILDCTALMLHDINPENVRTAVEYTMEHGAYSRTSPKISERLTPSRDIPAGHRKPGTVRPWETESAVYRDLSGDIDLVQRKWRECDASLYGYLWTTVLW